MALAAISVSRTSGSRVLPTSQLGKLNNWRPGEGTSGKALARNVYRYDYL
jgi:hypothetical protein